MDLDELGKRSRWLAEHDLIVRRELRDEVVAWVKEHCDLTPTGEEELSKLFERKGE